jgi:ATP-dependent Clp protease ATP-binding subunit ClpA
MQFSTEAKQLLERSWEQAKGLGSDVINPDHILLAIVQQADGTAAALLTSLGVSLQRIRGNLLHKIDGTEPRDAIAISLPAPDLRPKIKPNSIVFLAQEEARRLGHNFCGTEQILLGLLRDKTCIAAKALRSKGVTLRAARLEVEKIIGQGRGFVAVEIPFTPRAKRVLELSWQAARELGHNYIGSEHLLLGLIEEGDGVSARVLEKLGVDSQDLKEGVLGLIARSGPGSTERPD